MLNTLRMQDFLQGCPAGAWVGGAIDLRRVPRLKRETIAANLNDQELMKLWGVFHEERGWDSRDWVHYLNEDHYSDFGEFRRWLWRRFGIE
jgi:hypothetical protein